MTEKKKMGRPTLALKRHQITLRLDDDSNKLLTEYCSKYKVSRTEAMRLAIKLLPK